MSIIDRVITTEFQQVQGIISLHRSQALQTVNNENLLAAWEVGVLYLKDSKILFGAAKP